MLLNRCVPVNEPLALSGDLDSLDPCSCDILQIPYWLSLSIPGLGSLLLKELASLVSVSVTLATVD